MGTLSCGWRAALITWAAGSAVVGVTTFVSIQFDSGFDATGVGKVVVGGYCILLAMVVCSPISLALAGLIGFAAGQVDRRRTRPSVSY